MKKTLTAIAAALFLLSPITSYAAYVIHLKDGREFMTEQYIEDGDQIKFKVYGGLIGIQKDQGPRHRRDRPGPARKAGGARRTRACGSGA